MANRLAAETSPYLQQHAGNLVDWQPWDDAALAMARRENKPILLSIGYSACHWCHVMAHESFEDAGVAAVMNRLFVNIKVDREERPDLDQIYQSAHQLLAERAGGWPLTMFLTPDATPFFGGTYFPKVARYNLPGFVDLLEKIGAAYHTRRSEIEQQNRAVLAALAQTLPRGATPPGDFSRAPLQRALDLLASNLDPSWGGFGAAPKFPQATDLELLLRDGSAPALEMFTNTLSRMAAGGLHDQLGGGFFRYSVDARWEIPHFEKMLYDNGPLLKLYADAWLLTGDARYRSVVEATAQWVMREMQAPEGGYYASLDADADGQEGKFYVWSRDEARALLAPDEYAVAAACWGLNEPPNFEGKYWHLHVSTPLAAVASELRRELSECERLLAAARSKLFAARAGRVPPGRDEKILVSWNALMIEGMAHAGRVFQRPEWIASARRALGFIRCSMWRSGRLLAVSKDGQAHLDAYLDDYAFLLAALLELLQGEFEPDDLVFAEALAEVLLAAFEDKAGGAFFFTSHDHPPLIHRTKPAHDHATPSGNGVAACALQRLALLTGKTHYAAAAERTLALFHGALVQNPAGLASLLIALREWHEPPTLIVLRGPADALGNWQAALADCPLSGSLLIVLPNALSGLPAALDKPSSDAVNAWVGQRVKCLPAVFEPEALLEMLSKPGKVK